MDATYKTIKYALPLFFLCVHTNTAYMVAATVIIETGDSASLAETLTNLKEMNPSWNKKNFMIDASDIEVNAIHQVFPGKYGDLHQMSN